MNSSGMPSRGLPPALTKILFFGPTIGAVNGIAGFMLLFTNLVTVSVGIIYLHIYVMKKNKIADKQMVFNKRMKVAVIASLVLSFLFGILFGVIRMPKKKA